MTEKSNTENMSPNSLSNSHPEGLEALSSNKTGVEPSERNVVNAGVGTDDLGPMLDKSLSPYDLEPELG